MMRSSIILALAIVCGMALVPAAAHAYLLPPVVMTEASAGAPAEEAFARVDAEFASIRRAVPRTVLADGARNRHVRLSPAARSALASYEDVRDRHAFWTAVVDLKRDLLALYGDARPADAVADADGMAKTIIQTIYDLSQEYHVAFTALFQNFLVNRGLKKKGLCYHYVRDLNAALASRAWRFFDLHWGVAWEGKFLENNALVITAAGAPFETGLAVDAWRTAGKPFWTPVKGDHYPWKEGSDAEMEGE